MLRRRSQEAGVVWSLGRPDDFDFKGLEAGEGEAELRNGFDQGVETRVIIVVATGSGGDVQAG